MNSLASEVAAALDGKSIKQLAGEWGIPRWVIDELIHGRLKMPGAPYLVNIARGLGKSVEELATSQEEQEGSQPGGDRRRGKATASTS